MQDHQPSRGSSGWGDVLTRSHCPLLGSFFRGHWSETACPYFVGVSVWELTVLVANVRERNRDGEPDGSHWLCKKSQRATSQHHRWEWVTTRWPWVTSSYSGESDHTRAQLLGSGIARARVEGPYYRLFWPPYVGLWTAMTFWCLYQPL